MPHSLTFLNGNPVAATDPAIGITDAGFAIGEGAFETMVAVDGRIRRRDRHMARMAEGCALLGLPDAPWAQVDAAIAHFLRLKPTARLNIRFLHTRGPLAGGFGSDAIGKATSVVTLRPALPRAPGLSAALIDWPRRNPAGIETRFKSLGYGNESVARTRARAMGTDLAIMLSVDGHISCADSANLFARFGDELVTPDAADGPLCGTVRGAILETGAHCGLTISTGRLSLSDLTRADALIATNAGLEACVIERIEGMQTRLSGDMGADTAARLKTLLRNT